MRPAPTPGERVRGDQRVADLRLTQEQQLTRLRSELAVARQDAREQRTSATQAMARPSS
jgi:hypothetical protein